MLLAISTYAQCVAEEADKLPNPDFFRKIREDFEKIVNFKKLDSFVNCRLNGMRDILNRESYARSAYVKCHSETRYGPGFEKSLVKISKSLENLSSRNYNEKDRDIVQDFYDGLAASALYMSHKNPDWEPPIPDGVLKLMQESNK